MQKNKKAISRWLVLAGCVFALSACSSVGPIKYSDSAFEKADASQDRNRPVVDNTTPIPEGGKVTELENLGQTGVQPDSKASDYRPDFDDELVAVSASNMPVEDFVHLVFGEILDTSYVVDDSVKRAKGRATLKLKGEISKARLFELSKDVLAKEGITFEVKNDVLFFLNEEVQGVKQFTLGVGAQPEDVPLSSGDIVQVIPLEYVGWNSINRVIGFLTSARVQFVAENNSLIVKAQRVEVLQVIKVVNAFDRPSARGRHIGIFELTFISPKEFKEQLTELFKAEGLSIGQQADEGAIAITPLGRMKSVLVHASSRSLYERAKYWAEKLDVPASGDGRQYFTYFPKNVKAEELGKSLSNLFKLSMQGSVSSSSSSTGGDSNGGLSTASSGGSQSRRSAGAGGFVSESISMSVDEYQNALMFYATPSRYHEVLELIQQLDILPGQVLIEAAITEVTLEGSFSQGIDWTLSREPTLNENRNAIATLGEGLSYTLTGLDYNVTLDFLQSRSRVNILSKPRVLVMDGRTASLNVGTEIPVITQQSNDLDANSERLVQNVQYRTTGVSLNVTPSINSQGVISLKVQQQVSEAGENSLSDVNSPVILNRSFTTELLARDGRTVVLGGLISENRSDGGSQVPLLGDVPVLGNLFKSKNNSSNRVELLVMLTPRIIRSEDDINEVVDAMFDEYKNLERN